MLVFPGVQLTSPTKKRQTTTWQLPLFSLRHLVNHPGLFWDRFSWSSILFPTPVAGHQPGGNTTGPQGFQSWNQKKSPKQTGLWIHKGLNEMIWDICIEIDIEIKKVGKTFWGFSIKDVHQVKAEPPKTYSNCVSILLAGQNYWYLKMATWRSINVQDLQHHSLSNWGCDKLK